MNRPCPQRPEARQEVILTMRRAELLYDAANYAFVEGDLLNEDAEHVRHQVTDIAEAGNVDRATRVLHLAHAECVEMLHPYTRTAVTETALDDTLTAPEAYEVRLALPPTFAQSTVNLLRHLVHEFLVCSVLADWLGITHPESAPRWAERLEALRHRLRTALVSRRRPVRRPLQPF